MHITYTYNFHIHDNPCNPANPCGAWQLKYTMRREDERLEADRMVGELEAQWEARYVSFSLSLSLWVCMYICMCVCVCLSVCVYVYLDNPDNPLITLLHVDVSFRLRRERVSFEEREEELRLTHQAHIQTKLAEETEKVKQGQEELMVHRGRVGDLALLLDLTRRNLEEVERSLNEIKLELSESIERSVG